MTSSLRPLSSLRPVVYDLSSTTSRLRPACLREGVREELVCERLAWKAFDFDSDLLRQTDESMGQSLKYRLSK